MSQGYEQFPKDLNRRLITTLPTVNTEPKQITLWGVLDQNLKTRNELRNDFKGYVDPSSYWIPKFASFADYCNLTFIPNGIVVRKNKKSESKFKRGKTVSAWKSTKEGTTYGQPLAAFSTKYAVDNNHSMYEYLGQTHTPGKSRSPYNRIQIIKLASKGLSRQADFIKRLNLDDASVVEHIQSLKKIGLVGYESVSTENSGWARYGWITGKNPEHVKPVYQKRDLALKVARLLRDVKETDYREATKKLGYKHPGAVSNVLSGLARQGFARRLNPKFVIMKKLSDVRITDEGKDFLHDYIIPVENALQDRKDLDDMQEISHRFRNTTEGVRYAQEAMSLYERVSPAMKAKPKNIRENQVLNFIKSYENEHGFGPRNKEIRDGLHLGIQYLRHLRDRGVVERRTVGRKARYFIKK